MQGLGCCCHVLPPSAGALLLQCLSGRVGVVLGLKLGQMASRYSPGQELQVLEDGAGIS